MGPIRDGHIDNPKEARMVTIKDISKKCGVSPSTVSKALNGYDDIGEETAQMIRAVAQELGYRPNAAALALKTNRSNNLGVLFVDAMRSGLAHDYFSLILNSFKDEAERRGYDITFISQNIGGAKMSYYEHSNYRRCDGVVIASVDFTDPAVLELVNSEIPTVTIDHVFDSRTAILSDNVQGARDLVCHAHAMGHRRIAFIHGELTSVTTKRLPGFHKACAELGISVPEGYVVPARYHDPRASALATQKLLKHRERPSVILYPDDFSFLGGMTVIEKAGLSIPEDISVIGYDGIQLSQVLRPRLTTMKQDTEALGRLAAANLVENIESPKTWFPHQVLVPAELVEGGSVQKIGA